MKSDLLQEKGNHPVERLGQAEIPIQRLGMKCAPPRALAENFFSYSIIQIHIFMQVYASFTGNKNLLLCFQLITCKVTYVNFTYHM